MKLNKDGRVKKLIPLMLLLTLISALFVYFSFAEIHSISLTSPANGTWFSNGTWYTNGLLLSGGNTVNVSFNCTALLNGGDTVANVSLWLGLISSGSLAFNSTNQTAGTSNGTGVYINVSNIADGEYYWTCEATNTTGNKTRALTNWTLYVDTARPHTINLSDAGAYLTTGRNTTYTTIVFNWTAMDNIATRFLCNLTLDGVLGNKTVLATNGSTANVQVASLAEGAHEWNVTCWDLTNATSNTNQSLETRRLTVDNKAPETIAPNVANNTWWNSAAVNFNWTATNTGTSVLYCNVTVDGVINTSTRTAASGVMSNYTVQNLANGMHTWYANCSTLLNTWNGTGTLSPTRGALWVDTVKPHTIKLSDAGAYLTTGRNASYATLDFNWTAMDNVANQFLCNLTLDGVLGNKSVLGTNGSTANAQVTNLAEGAHEWNVTCWDPTNMSSNTNKSLETRRFTVDTLPPSRIAPELANGSNLSSNTLSINWTPTDATSSVVNCSLVVDNVVNATQISRAANTLASYSVAGLSEGMHTWYANCTDYAGNANSTGSFGDYGGKRRAFFVDLTNPVPTLTLGSSAVVLRGTQTVSCASTDTRDPNPSESFTVQLPNGDYSSDLDGTFTDTSVIGTYTVKCSTSDDSGRSASTTSTFTVGSEITTAGGSTSGGGGAVAAPTPTMSTTISTIAPETPAVVRVDNAKIAVSEIKLEVNEEASNVKVTVQAITAPPSGTSAAEGEVYKYLNINKENLDDANLKSAKVSFFVARTWLAENGVAPANVVLKRYADRWQDLPTKVLTSDDENFYFEAETPGFSVFAIGVKAAAPAAEAEEEAEEALEEEEAPAEEAPAAPAEPAKKSLAWLYALLAVVAVGVVAAFVLMKRKK